MDGEAIIVDIIPPNSPTYVGNISMTPLDFYHCLIRHNLHVNDFSQEMSSKSAKLTRIRLQKKTLSHRISNSTPRKEL